MIDGTILKLLYLTNRVSKYCWFKKKINSIIYMYATEVAVALINRPVYISYCPAAVARLFQTNALVPGNRKKREKKCSRCRCECKSPSQGVPITVTYRDVPHFQNLYSVATFKVRYILDTSSDLNLERTDRCGRVTGWRHRPTGARFRHGR
jgi:hypothetical protein